MMTFNVRTIQETKARVRPQLFECQEDPRVIRSLLLSSWLPSDNDKNFINSLMVQELNPGKTASWITKPKRGINNQDIEYNYVDLN